MTAHRTITRLQDQDDVDAAALVDGRSLQYDAATGKHKYVNGSQAVKSNNPTANAQMGQASGGRTYCGIHSSGRLWSFTGTGLYQVDSLTAVNWQIKNLPANCSTSGQNIKVVVFNNLMYILTWNTVTTRFEVYSAPLVTGGTQPTWTGPLLTLSANAILIHTAFRATSVGVFVGEYSSSPDIAAGPSVWFSSDGTTFSRVLGPLGATTRHIHGIYEDPFNLGTIYITVGDPSYNPPQYVYKGVYSGGISFAGIAGVNNQGWQAVSMGFSKEYVWFAADNAIGGGTYVMDRTAQLPMWASNLHHKNIAVPGGCARVITDLTISGGSPNATSATAAFTSADVGRKISGPNSLPYGTYIFSVTNATTIVLSQNATGTTGEPATIFDEFYANAFCGATDPASGWFYVVPNDTSPKYGSVGGLFVFEQQGVQPSLIQTFYGAGAVLGAYELFIQSGLGFVGRYGPITLPVKTT